MGGVDKVKLERVGFGRFGGGEDIVMVINKSLMKSASLAKSLK